MKLIGSIVVVCLSLGQMWDELYEKLMSISSHVPVCELKCSRNGDIITKPLGIALL